jgi:hypothetical protein
MLNDDHDLRKLHSEITQIAQQRFVLTTLAITVFGVVEAWTIPKMSDLRLEIVFLSAMLLNLLLLALFLYSMLLRAVLRCFSVYLLERGSQWERDWASYRKRLHPNYTLGQGLMFCVLTALTTLLPECLSLFYKNAPWPSSLLVYSHRFFGWGTLALVLAFTLLGDKMAPRAWTEAAIRDRWRGVLESGEQRE